VTNHSDATDLFDECINLFEKRRDYLIQKNKTEWSEFSIKELENEKEFKGIPIGRVVIVVDELAELSKKATEKSAKSELQEKIATIARLARVTGIHLVLGTQRPDKSTVDMQSKDNLPTRVCFSVPSVSASTLVIGDMTASTLGGHSGRAVFQRSGNKIVQAPLIKRQEVDDLMKSLKERLVQSGYDRRLMKIDEQSLVIRPKVVLK
jgi:S-DNA-T family DNA segregation ATPase FtsK/SpoIIIE